MFRIRCSNFVSAWANLGLCLVLVLSFASAGLANQAEADQAENELYLPMIMKNVIPYIESTGLLDPSFSEDGWAAVNFNDSYEDAKDIAIQSDGKIVVVGSVGAVSSGFALARYNSDGSLDASFSGDGKVVSDFDGSGNGEAIVLLSNGKLIVAGYAYRDTTDFALAQFNADGSLDTSFSGDGKVVTDFAGIDDYGQAVAVQSDGKIIVAGYTGIYGAFDFALARYNPDGSLDTSFSGDGKVVTDFDDGNDRGFAVAVQPEDGKIILAGSHEYTEDYFSYSDIALARYNPDGSLDTSFSQDGLVTVDLGDGFCSAQDLLLLADGTLVVSGYAYTIFNDWDFILAFFDEQGGLNNSVSTDFILEDDYAYSVALQEDSKIVVAGYTDGTTSYDIALARYTPDGSLDTSFGTDGKVLTDIAGGYDQGKAVAVGAGGEILVAGYTVNTTGDFALVQYTSSGSLDVTFSEDGVQLTQFGGSLDWGRAVAVQPDGKVIMAGSYYPGGTIALARFNPDGSLDTNFDLDGKVSAYISWGSTYDLIIQADGKIVAAGHSGGDFALARFYSDGSLDTGFDFDGIVTTDFTGNSDAGYAIAVQSDGKILVAGVTYGATTDFALARYNPDGSLDTSFSEDGMLVTDFASGSDTGLEIALQVDGKIIVAGYTSGATADFALARYNPDGSLDTGFDGDGMLVTDIDGGDDYGQAIALQLDGKIVVAGYTYGTTSDFALARYNPDGSLDTSFNGDGMLVTDFAGADDFAYAVALQPNGKIVVAGCAKGATIDFALARYHPDGSLDTTFASVGKLVTDYLGSYDYGQAIALLPDGKIIVAGYASNGVDADFALVRYK